MSSWSRDSHRWEAVSPEVLADTLEMSSSASLDVDLLTDSRRLSSGFLRREMDGSKIGKSSKVPLRRSREEALRHFLLFHAVPLGVAVLLIVLNLQTRFYGFDGRWIPALQFAAKAHELLMQVSIGAILVAYLQFLLTYKKPVPFGAIFSAYDITQMSYLWSREFWGAATASNFRGAMKVMFVLFVPFSVLLTAGVGPSTAITMQPRFVNFTIVDYPLALNTTTTLMYPEVFDQPGLSLIDPQNAYFLLSPATGWEYLQNLPPVRSDQDTQSNAIYVLQWFNTNERVMPPLYTVQIPTLAPYSPSGGSESFGSTRSLYVQYAPNSTFATISHVPVAGALNFANVQSPVYLNEQTGAVLSNINMPQAFTSVLCQLNTISNENDTRPIQFPSTYVAGSPNDTRYEDFLNDFSVSNYTAITRRQIWDNMTQNSEGRIIWLDDIETTRTISGRSLGAIIVQPELCRSNDSFLTTSACIIGAQWANVTLYQQKSSNNFFDTSGAAQNLLTPDSLSSLPAWSQQPLNISATWAQSLTPLTTTQNRTVADNLLRAMPITNDICPTNGSYALASTPMRPFMHEALVAALVANGLSQAAGLLQVWQQEPPGSGPWSYFDIRGDEQTMAEAPGVVLVLHRQLPGYAWNRDGVPVLLACGILILYSLYVVGYVGYTFWTGRSSLAWSTISDLVMLALVSQPPGVSVFEDTLEDSLKDVGVRKGKPGTFQKGVTVKAVDGRARLRLVFPQDEKVEEG